ncbi:gamma-aminobutyraldehyde dehydrogenase [Microbacterium laevaniformans]|uniref:aminobutyraldehyde dehydrogenase n=1 Tax=Microbacterium TaxID=33882 RepID=UPI0002585C1B|nr:MULTISPECIES: aminobutyraldehyde dehydrogenase [Microbacterium]EIC09393.1 Aldehyde Dehydrogenase [Microbacterium laevaniformans OR221]EPD84646.1 1-pyrroline dehydrogenase [Microbacterium sp. oral taxon 186 str. F0373]MBM7753633.1 betaine-aldehyde dehydrogenase [Microbacterium laevaniformans]GLJ64190.1 gamma-aminobutyraldehyde dehydrogenase [Microbacterium laevaniformans]
MTASTAVLRNIIDGVPVASSGAALPLVSPVTGEVYGHAPVSTAEEVDAAFAAASRAFDTWKRTTPAQRQLLLFRLADALEAHAEEFADLESQDTGKPRASLVADEIVQSVDQLRFFAGAARDLDGRAAAEYAEGFTSYVRREPIGVVAQVTPWNYPLNMAVWKIGPALAAGNTVVLKPSETTPQTTVRLAELAAGILPAGVLNVVLGDRETGRMLVEHPTPQLVAITGSVRAGMQVAASAARDLKRVHLELGGKAPALVFADADLDRAARGIVEAAFFNAGQDCTAATRVLVDAAVHDELVAKLVAHTRDHAKTGAPDDPEAFFGPVNNPDQLARVQGFVDRLPSHASIAIGGRRQGDTGCFFEATIVTGVRQDDEVVQQEIFGPVLTVQPFTSEEDALALANGVPYALAASVWTREHARALRFSRDLDFGCVWINAHIPFVSDMPHGGFKHSGYGKDLSVYGFEDYTRLKHVMASLD